MALTVFDDEVNNRSVNKNEQVLHFEKLAQNAVVAGVPFSLWAAAGQPIAGTYPTSGKANGRKCSRTSTGAWKYTNPTSPALMYLSLLETLSLTASTAGDFYLFDRLAEVQLDHSEATGSISGCVATDRLQSTSYNSGQGDGGQIILTTGTVLSAASNTFNLGYTNQVGTTSRTTATITTVASRNPGNCPANFIWVPLQSGDTGVRSIDSITALSGTATGTIVAAIVRNFGCLDNPLTVAGISAARNFRNNVPSWPNLIDGTCFDFMFLPNAATTPRFVGELSILEG